METYEYHQLLKHLYFEGYANSYEEAEDLIEEMSDEEFDFLYEDVFGEESYETIISYLLDEGYAEDLDSAEQILENMSEGWKTDVLKSVAKGTGKLVKKASKTKLAKKANKFLTRTALGALGVPLIS